MKQKGFSSILLLLIFLGIVASVVIAGTIYWPSYKHQQYILKSEPILKEFKEEIEAFKKENFLAIRNIKNDKDDAREALEKHQKDLESAQKKVADLENQYKDINSFFLSDQTNQKFIMLFEQTNKLFDQYEKNLILREKVFEAYSDKMDIAINEFYERYYQGNDRTGLITTTDEINRQADQGLNLLENVEVPADERKYYELKLKSLTDIRDYSLMLNDYYRNSNYVQAEIALGELNSRIESDNLMLKNEIETYIRESSIAKSLFEIEALTAAIETELKTKK